MVDLVASASPLHAFRAASAYVLLGDPGSGKTTAFKDEQEALGADGEFLSARDFLAFRPEDHPEWRGKTLFIDGLDEVRAGASDARTPLDAIRSHLDRLGRPRFRLSCRAADWLGANDRSKLAAVAPDARLTVLQLDPLADSDIEALLKAHRRVDDIGAFIREARERGVDGFLVNPLNLDMLVGVVAGAGNRHVHGARDARRDDMLADAGFEAGDWPASRTDLFERACRQMARERNDEHVIAAGSPSESPSLDEVLEAAGRLCAVQLLAGAAGYARSRARPAGPGSRAAAGAAMAVDDHPDFEECGQEWNACPDGARRRRRLHAALATRLFSAQADGRVGPVHRHVAEFMGARYLAGLIRGPDSGRGLPARRVLALMAGGDGIVVSQLRGLSAWLAAHCREARRDLVGRDPIGVGLYGDVGAFSDEEKHALLTSLEGEASRFSSASWTAAAFAPLAAPAMEPVFRKILTGAGARKQPSFSVFVLVILTEGSRLPGLASTLLDLVRDETRLTDVRVAALDAFIHNRPPGRERTMVLQQLLVDVRAGRIADANGDLLGTLLSALYPDELSPSDVWEHSPASVQIRHVGRYWLFWKRTLGESCDPAHVADHLDALARRDAADQVLPRFFPEDLLLKLLARGLERHGDSVETGRLYDWLGVGLEPWTIGEPEIGDGSREVSAWLERRPEIQKSIVAEGLRRGESDPRLLQVGAREVWQRFHGSGLPADFGLWCLHRAELAPDRRIARWLLERALAAMIERRGDRGLSAEVLLERAGRPGLAGVFAGLSESRLDDDYFLRQKRVSRAQHEWTEKRRTWNAHVRDQEDALRTNRSDPRLLDHIAAAYFGRLVGVDGKEPLERLKSLFLGDDGLVEAALAALRGAVHRNDVPDVDEIIELRGKNQEHWLSRPFRAGLAELYGAGKDVSQCLVAGRLRIALAFYYCSASDGEPAWYGRLVDAAPGIVADVLTRCSVAALRSRWEHVAGLWALLAHNEDHATVARLASLRILRSFPTRCTAGQLDDLNDLIWSALRHADREPFAELIDGKLSRASLNVAQRVRWMAAAFVLSPEAGAESLIAFIERDERRIRELAAFLLGEWRRRGVRAWSDRLGAAGLRALVRLLGASFGPCAPAGGVTSGISVPWEAARYVDEMIGRLAESPDSAAGAALDALAAEPPLRRWRRTLEQARDRQRVIHRDAAYRPPDLREVCRTLNDGPPANAGDLAALVEDRLREIGSGIQNGNDNGWRPYWNEGPPRRADEPKHEESRGSRRRSSSPRGGRHGVNPKHEESCRDALLRDLRPRLPDCVDAQPEGRYANDTRADIRVACGGFHVPVEIKRHFHRELWSALRKQLIARYASDPATGGYGIYLVLWFGEGDTAERRTPPPPSGLRPSGREALEARLSQELTPDERRRITVCVLDVSTPRSAPAGMSRAAG